MIRLITEFSTVQKEIRRNDKCFLHGSALDMVALTLQIPSLLFQKMAFWRTQRNPVKVWP